MIFNLMHSIKVTAGEQSEDGVLIKSSPIGS